MVNEPSVFELLKFYLYSFFIRGYFEISVFEISRINCNSSPGCSKLTTSLVSVSLKFQTLISQICQYFLLKKCEKLLQASLIFSTKKINVFGYKVVKHFTS